MYNFRFFSHSLILVLIFSALAFAQTEMTAVSAGKIGLIDTTAFADEKTGIREIYDNYQTLDAEFKPQSDDLETLRDKIQKLEKEFEKFRTMRGCYPLEVYKDLDRNIEEYDMLIREYKLLENVAKQLYEKRKAEVFAAVDKKIAEALRRFIKEKSYALILDVAKMDDDFILVNSGEIESLTKEFIRYYNENSAKAQ